MTKKFFIPLGFQYGRDAGGGQTGQPVNPYYHVGSIFGPYNDELAVGEAVVRVAHPVHVKEMPGAGFGECQYTDAPYCPNCERKPSSGGAPVYESAKGLLDG